MKQRIFNRTLRKQLRRQPRQSRFVNYEKARTIRLLFNSDGTDEPIERMLRQLAREGKQAEAWGYFAGKPKACPADTEALHRFTRRDTTCWGRPCKRLQERMNARPCDLLIDLSTRETLPLLYAALAADATMKAGTHTGRREVFDFLLDTRGGDGRKPSADEQFIFEQIIFYLKSIQTTD